MNIVLYVIGMFLLYCPPLFVWIYPVLTDKIVIKISKYYLVLLSIFFMSVMMYLMPTVPYFVFLFYAITFNCIFFFYNYLFKSKGEGLRVAIYVCFAISVLWEWPIQLTYHQNWVAVALSGFKALSIPFLLITLKKRGWYLSINQAFFLNIIVFTGLYLTYSLTIKHTTEIFYDLHYYRLLWLAIFVLMIIETYINSKEPKNRQYNRS